MSLARVLIVDDSEAMLAYGRAALAGRYAVTTARDGAEGLARARALRPDAILLDLSMPELEGEQVLAALAADPALAAIPVIVVSSEHERAERCVGRGAAAVLHKPASASAVLGALDRLIGAARAAEAAAGMAILTLSVGAYRFAIPLAPVTRVAPECATARLAAGPPWLSELVDLGGEPVCVADLARRFRTEYAEPRRERKLVFVRVGQTQLGLRVDRVLDPELVSGGQLVPAGQLGGAGQPPLDRLLLAVARVGPEPLPIIDPAALLSPALARRLAGVITSAGRGRA